MEKGRNETVRQLRSAFKQPDEIVVPVKTFAHASYRLAFMPERPKAILVIAPESNSTPDHWTWAWEKFARANDLAMIGVTMKDSDPNVIEGYADAKVESGQALFKAIGQLAADHPSLLGLKLLLWGFSAGGQFAYEMNAQFPEQVLGFVANKGGVYYTALCSQRARDNRGIIFVGERDEQFRVFMLLGIYGLNKRAGSNWELVIEKCGHSPGDSERISQKLFAELVNKL